MLPALEHGHPEAFLQAGFYYGGCFVCQRFWQEQRRVFRLNLLHASLALSLVNIALPKSEFFARFSGVRSVMRVSSATAHAEQMAKVGENS